MYLLAFTVEEELSLWSYTTFYPGRRLGQLLTRLYLTGHDVCVLTWRKVAVMC